MALLNGASWLSAIGKRKLRKRSREWTGDQSQNRDWELERPDLRCISETVGKWAFANYESNDDATLGSLFYEVKVKFPFKSKGNLSRPWIMC